MNNFSPPTKYQQQDDIGCYGGINRTTHVQRHARSSPSRSIASKHTNTPAEFMLCLRCHEKLDKKHQETYANCPLGDCDRSLAEYSKALNYINSCHGIINQMMKQTSRDCSDFMRMPDLPNFMDLFHSLTNPLNTPSQGGEGSAKSSKKSTHESRYNSQLFNDGSRNNSNEKNLRPISPQLYPGRQQNSEDPAVKMTMKGKFIELLPDVKQSKYKKQDNFSPGTTESEESDLELNLNVHKNTRIAMPNKFKNKIKGTHEKVIYEEENVEDDCGNAFKKDQDSKFNQKNKDDPKNKKISPIPATAARNKSSLLPTGATVNTAIINENTRKLKQRSSSTVTPREKSKFIGKRGVSSEVTTNFSDTIITAGNIVGQGKKFGAKTLCTPIDIRNNELSQQELDKYAKELLGSESPLSRSPRSKSPASTACRSSTSPDKLTKNDQQDKNKRFQKPIPSPTLKSQAADQKRRNSQEKSSIPSNNGNNMNKVASASTTNIQQRQEQQINGNAQARKYRKSYTAQHQQQIEQNQNKKVNSCRRSTNTYTSNIPQHQNKNGNYCYGNSNQTCNVGENNYSRSKLKESARVQEENAREKATFDANNEDTEKEYCTCHLDQLNLLCDNTETLSMRARVTRISKILTTPRKISPQYAVTTKPNDFFTNRKENHTQVTCDKEEDVESDGNPESDDIKTDSDIEEDHFEKEGNEGSNSASAQMTQVLTRLGLVSNASEVQQLIQEAKSTRAHDECNRPFREPRKAIEDPECIVKLQDNSGINEVYPTESMSQLRRTISEESSDIKSDEDIYANMEVTRSKTTPYNFCLGTGRYQP